MSPRALTRGTIIGRAILDARTVHIPDVAEAHVREEYPETRTFAAGHRSLLGVPLVREDTGDRRDPHAAAGSPPVHRQTDQAPRDVSPPRPSSRSRTCGSSRSCRRATRMSPNRSSSRPRPRSAQGHQPLDIRPAAGVRRLEKALFGCAIAAMGSFFDLTAKPVVQLASTTTVNPDYVAYRRQHPIPINRDTITGRAAFERRPDSSCTMSRRTLIRRPRYDAASAPERTSWPPLLGSPDAASIGA